MKQFKTFIKYMLLFIIPNILYMPDYTFYNELNLPFFAPSRVVFNIWWILYILISFVMTKVTHNTSDKDKYDIQKIFVINYFFNMLFTPLFFGLKSLGLGMLTTAFTFLTAIVLFMVVYEKNKKLSLLLIPYILWTLYASILSIAIVILN